MNRRKAVGTMTILVGGALLSTSVLQSCSSSDRNRIAITDADKPLLDEIAETIIPATATSPGAKETAVGAYMQLMVNECCTPAQQRIFIDGLDELEASCRSKYGTSFLAISAANRKEFINALDDEAKGSITNSGVKNNKGIHYFSFMKELVVKGYLTSKAGATQVLQYELVPGKYQGCVAYKQNTPIW